MEWLITSVLELGWVLIPVFIGLGWLVIAIFAQLTKKPLEWLGVNVDSERGSFVWVVVAIVSFFAVINIISVVTGRGR